MRALTLEFNDPVVSLTQINRQRSFLDLKELNFNYIAECISIANDADFVGILGHDPDKLQYESEIHYKVVKNRLGGRIGTIGKLYMDNRSLKLYDEDEFDQLNLSERDRARAQEVLQGLIDHARNKSGPFQSISTDAKDHSKI